MKRQNASTDRGTQPHASAVPTHKQIGTSGGWQRVIWDVLARSGGYQGGPSTNPGGPRSEPVLPLFGYGNGP